MEASFGSLLDLFSGIVLPLVEKAEELHYVQKAGASSCAPALASSTPPLSYDPDELRGELLSHAGRLGAMMPPALAAASSLPALVTLATTALTSSRREGPHGVDPAIELLTALSHQARAYPAMGPQAAAVRNDPNTPAAAAAAAVRGRLSSALDGAAGESLLRGCIVGLADGLPLPSVSRVSHILAPLLHLPSWRSGGVDSSHGGPLPLSAWAYAALSALPEVDGVPDAQTRQGVLQTLCTAPDSPDAAGRVCEGGARAARVEADRVCAHVPADAVGRAGVDFVTVFVTQEKSSEITRARMMMTKKSARRQRA